MICGMYRGSLFSIFIICVHAIFLMSACDGRQQTGSEIDEKQLKESLPEVNKMLIATERQEIDDFVTRYNWPVKETGTGLQYYIYEEGQGRQAEKGFQVLIDYSISLLNGDVVYTSNDQGARRFLIGRGGVETGLEEGILLMREGDRAKFIMPSHLAHGVPGDGARIPARAVIVYDVYLLKIE